MSKRKGVSAEEKRVRVLQIFYEKKEFFQLKELEKIAPKEKGVIAQSVKDVVQSLVDDGLVDTDKIGTSIYFWAYPSKAKHSRKRKLTDLSNKLEETNKKLKKVKENVGTANLGREESDERTTILENIASLKTEEARLKDEIQKYKDSDPEVLEQMKQQIQVAKEAANRWTDNLFAIKSWCKNKFFIEGSVLDKQFGIDPEMDYLN
ncbi:meiotic nuclear division protein 1 homolog [Schistocerca piceifrons]|uniref:meiotic nuclear division protein 1 homolog n=1 Tax=Schistocerca piceifrons TaxID=274613 RepID=UPI001F5F45CF|nr:meiotic nuclear division protein 1 homolog [Schistocerca piceifrons]XP_047108638.1 meiotic nuclear division protein 1 homolog [Schistocerca piceifrons]